MEGLCDAFAKLASVCEGGTMMENLDTGREKERQNIPLGQARPRVAGAGRGRGMPTVPAPSAPVFAPTVMAGGRGGPTVAFSAMRADPYQRLGPAVDATALQESINAISNVLTELPEKCGCEPATRENIYYSIMQNATERNRWVDAPIEEVRQRVSYMARHGTEDNEMCVPWRLCSRGSQHLPVTQVEGEQFDADFVIVAPSPQKYYEGETIVFTPRIAVQPKACLISVVLAIECKFKACWEMAHLVSLVGRDKQERLPYTARLMGCLANSRITPGETPWAIVRPFARPPNAIAPPVLAEVVDMTAGPAAPTNLAEASAFESLQWALADVMGGEADTSVDLTNNPIPATPPPPQQQQQQQAVVTPTTQPQQQPAEAPATMAQYAGAIPLPDGGDDMDD